jgi:hypothetical protein
MLPFRMVLYYMVFNQRIFKKQPAVAPMILNVIFVTRQRSRWTLFDVLFIWRIEIFFFQSWWELHLISFLWYLCHWLKLALNLMLCESGKKQKIVWRLDCEKNGVFIYFQWHYWRKKDFEEFFTDNEVLDMERFENLGMIKIEVNFDKIG